jgi:hypothetical protein
LISGDKGINGVVGGEDEVEIGDGQEERRLFFDPLGFFELAALGAMAVSTGIVGDLDGSAVLAKLNVTLELTRPVRR